MQQQTCPNCGFKNRIGVVFCENCGASLLGNAPISTKAIAPSDLAVVKPAEPPAVQPPPVVSSPVEPKPTEALSQPVVQSPSIGAPPPTQAAPVAPPESGTRVFTSPVEAAISSVGSDVFMDGWTLRIEVEGGTEPIIVKPRQELILGRRDPATGAMPDVDLTPFAGYRMGVSRRHSAIRVGEGNRLDLWDLGSSNGTFLNGTRLVAYRPYKMRDGDEIRLGQMTMKAYFQPFADSHLPKPTN